MKRNFSLSALTGGDGGNGLRRGIFLAPARKIPRKNRPKGFPPLESPRLAMASFAFKLSWYGFDTPLSSLSRFLCAAFGNGLGPRRRCADRRQKRQETMVSGQARPGLSQFLTRIRQKRRKPKLSAGDARAQPLPFSFPPLSLMQEKEVPPGGDTSDV